MRCESLVRRRRGLSKCLPHEDTIDSSGRQAPDCGKEASLGRAYTTLLFIPLDGIELVRRQRDSPQLRDKRSHFETNPHTH